MPSAIELEQEQLHAELSKKWGPDNVFTTSELTTQFNVTSFSYGICFVTRRSDNIKGTLDFSHSPRLYYNFRPSS